MQIIAKREMLNAMQELSDICNVYKRTDVINVQTYNTAMYISLATAVLFLSLIHI